MKEKVIFTTALCLSAMTPMMAQNITGKVMNTKGEPLAFANVVLLNRTDSAFVKGAVSGEDGSFAIDSSCNGGIIKVTSVGYKTICKDCTSENVGINLCDLQGFGKKRLKKVVFFIQVSHVSPTRPVRAEAPSPGQRPGYYGRKLVAL